jgi:hypothetical protein
MAEKNMLPPLKIAVAGAGIYGSTIAIHLAMNGCNVSLFDPLGIIRAASAINQYRIHRGYHYPRSYETISEILEARSEFIEEYKPAIVENTEHYYAIPYHGTNTSPDEFENICDLFSLPIKECSVPWINLDFIKKCYAVEEQIYDAEILRTVITQKIRRLNIRYIKAPLIKDLLDDFDYIIYATYGTSGSHTHFFEKVQIQVAEKMLILLPEPLQKKSLVVIDGPFTAFDPYRNTKFSLFGSAEHTVHWFTRDPEQPIPSLYNTILNGARFIPVKFTHFHKMVEDAKKSVPMAGEAEYIGSRFTLRIVEDNPKEDRRILRVKQTSDKVFHVFSGKITGAVKAAKLIGNYIKTLVNEGE